MKTEKNRNVRVPFLVDFVFFPKGGPFGRRNSPAKFGRKIGRFFKNLKKKKNFFFFSQVFLRPAHYTLGTLLRPKSQKKHELGCFEHLEFIPQPFSVPPVHFVWASALSKNRKISKKKKSIFLVLGGVPVSLRCMWTNNYVIRLQMQIVARGTTTVLSSSSSSLSLYIFYIRWQSRNGCRTVSTNFLSRKHTPRDATFGGGDPFFHLSCRYIRVYYMYPCIYYTVHAANPSSTLTQNPFFSKKKRHVFNYVPYFQQADCARHTVVTTGKERKVV